MVIVFRTIFEFKTLPLYEPRHNLKGHPVVCSIGLKYGGKGYWTVDSQAFYIDHSLRIVKAVPKLTHERSFNFGGGSSPYSLHIA